MKVLNELAIMKNVLNNVFIFYCTVGLFMISIQIITTILDAIIAYVYNKII